MDKIMDSIMVVRFDEEDRIRGVINELIAQKLVKSFKAYAKVRKSRPAHSFLSAIHMKDFGNDA